jgi:hypothetical protein
VSVSATTAQATAAAPPAEVAWTEAVAAPPAGGVEAGTLLGAGGADAGALAGEGVVALERPGGRVELRAARDGVPAIGPGGVSVDPSHRVAGNLDAAVGDRDVRGSLAVEGHVVPGRTVRATGSLRVGGTADRAELLAGADLVVAGRLGGATVGGGALHTLHRRLHRPLRDAAAEIDALVAVVAQLQAAAGARGRSLPAATAIAALRADRFAALADGLARADALLGEARRDWPGLCAGLAARVAAGRQALEDPEGGADPIAALEAAAPVLAAAVPQRRPSGEAAVSLGTAHSCTVVASGSLRLTGSGATDCDIAVAGDLFATAGAGVVRSGLVRVGGRVRARELAGRAGARLRIVLEDPRPGEEILRADVVQAGVDIVVGGEMVRVDRRRADVRLRVDGGRAVLEGD